MVNHQLVIKRKDAIRQRLKKYFTGKPCKNGHIAEKRCPQGYCMECSKSNETDRLRAKKWYENNTEKAKSKNAAYRALNAEKMRLRTKIYKNQNPEAVRCWNRNRKSLKKKCDGQHTATEINNLLLHQDFKCNACLIYIKDSYHADHIVPLIHGGTNYISNIQILCPKCNLSKGKKTMKEWKNHG